MGDATEWYLDQVLDTDRIERDVRAACIRRHWTDGPGSRPIVWVRPGARGDVEPCTVTASIIDTFKE